MSMAATPGGGAAVGAKAAAVGGPAPPPVAKAAVPFPEVFARDAIIAWFRGEFAAANAIIDALCSHLTQIDERGSAAGDYDAIFAAIHRRRMNWIPVLHMQKYFSIADVSIELRRSAAARRAAETEEARDGEQRAQERKESEAKNKNGAGVILKEEQDVANNPSEEGEAGRAEGLDRINGDLRVSAVVVNGEKEDEETEDSSGDSPVADDGGSPQAPTGSMEDAEIWSEHDDPAARPDRIKTFKGFVAKEPVKGHMVNVVKGLKLYEDIFTGSELSKLTEFINELRLSGRRGELSGHTFIYFNKQLKGNKREIIQLGAPIFQPTKEDASSHIEPIPKALQSVVDHLIQWRLIPETRRPNSCIINFFDEDEHSQPYFKPPHLDNPVSTLLLSETTMAFGRFLVSDHQGNYRGSLSLTLKDGSLLVMRGNSADLARHVICPSSHTRISVTFVRVRPSDTTAAPAATVSPSPSPSSSPMGKAMTLWQPEQKKETAAAGGGGLMIGGVARWGGVPALQAPVVLFAPPRPVVLGPPARRFARGGTGVFLPWTVGPKKYHKHVPPRIQRRRLASLPPPPLEAAV
ncbi:unnamed protein product [Spirodela intermedia]|uniref:Fe2OG dioxygenase domain-containing protein n=1 Tax=Spirodela intermedia TaxID=51605 RepID=A0A7I8KQH4_SPIIN|nr:unnamed protein product [Spirodela intermedia]